MQVLQYRTRLIGEVLSFLQSLIKISMAMNLRRIIDFLNVGIWQVKETDVSPLRFLLIEIVKKVVLAIRFFTTKRVVSEAAALTYSTLLALVPIMAVVFAIARGFGYNIYIEQWFRSAFQSQPQTADVIVGFVNSYLVHTKSGIFLGFGLLLMLYTVLMLVSNIEAAFNAIWQVKKPRSIFRTFTDYLAMFFLFPIIIVLTSSISILVATAADGIADLFVVGPIVGFMIDLIPYVVMSALFIGLYVFMPNTHVRISCAIVPGILAGVAMQCVQLVYIHSQIWVSSYNAIYGSFAALPLLMLWVQLSWIICLFGAELCYTNQNLDYYDYNMQTSDISHRYRTMLSVLLMSRICKRFAEGKQAYTALELRTVTDIPIRIVNDLIYDLIEARMVVELSADEKGAPARYMPAESIDRLSVGTLIDRMEAQGRWRLNIPIGKFYNSEWKKLIHNRINYLDQQRNVLLQNL